MASCSLLFSFYSLSEIRKKKLLTVFCFFVITHVFTVYIEKGYTCAKYIVNWHCDCESQPPHPGFEGWGVPEKDTHTHTICRSQLNLIQPLPAAVKIPRFLPIPPHKTREGERSWERKQVKQFPKIEDCKYSTLYNKKGNRWWNETELINVKRLKDSIENSFL